MCDDCRRTVKWLPHWKCHETESAATCGASLKGHFGHGPFPSPPPAAHYGKFSAHSALGCSKVHRKERGVGGGAVTLTEVRRFCCFSQPSPCSHSFFLFLSSVGHYKLSGGCSEKSQSPTATFSERWLCADIISLFQPLSFLYSGSFCQHAVFAFFKSCNLLQLSGYFKSNLVLINHLLYYNLACIHLIYVASAVELRYIAPISISDFLLSITSVINKLFKFGPFWLRTIWSVHLSGQWILYAKHPNET